MLELSEEDYRKLHRTLGGAPENFPEWYARHVEWEQARRAEATKPDRPLRPPKRGSKRVGQE